MAQYNDSGYKAFACAGAISAFRRVKLSGNPAQLNLATKTDVGIGQLRDASFNAGDYRTVVLRNKPGTTFMVASGAISAGGDVFPDDNGKVGSAQAAGGVATRIGIALQAATADGDVIEVLPTFGAL